MKNLQTITLLNEKGIAKPQVRAGIKEQAIANLTLGGEHFEVNERGDLYVAVAQDVTGATIYAKVELTISTLDLPNLAKKESKSRKVQTQDVSVPSLF